MISLGNSRCFLRNIIYASLLMCSADTYGQTRILFDATKGEMVGNADWVIDADQWNVGVGVGGAYTSSSAHKSNPQQIPTPAQSGITAGTPETYWSGGASAWAVDCAKKGYVVESLPWNGEISYGNTGNPQDLSHYKVFVINEPNMQFITAEKIAILQFVQNGGSLFMIADHDASDRNGDGWDSPKIWNDLFSDNTITTNPFGITFDYVDFSQVSTNISATSTDPIIHGSMGNVAQVEWAGGTTMTLDPSKNPTIKGVVFRPGTTPGNTKVMVAYGKYGSGKIAAMGDSSPADDGTGNPDCTLYDGYFDDAAGNHQLLIMNITMWLATSATAVNDITGKEVAITVYPNPTTINTGTFITTSEDLHNIHINVYSVTGREVFSQQMSQFNANDKFTLQLAAGTYFARITSNETVQTVKISVY